MITHDEFRHLATWFTDEPNYPHPEAMKKFRKVFKDLFVNVGSVTGKYTARNQVEICPFPDESARLRYAAAWTDYCEKKAQLGQSVGGAGNDSLFKKWAIQRTFEQKAELEKASIIAARSAMEQSVSDKAIVIAVKYKNTLAKIVRLLVSQYGIRREKISLIWGGDDAYAQSKRLTIQEMGNYLSLLGQGEKLPRRILHLLDKQLSETDDDRLMIAELNAQDLNLGAQSQSERQRNIDNFQNGTTNICIFTFAAGGIGLSLHHTDVNSLGQAVLLKPRRTFCSVCWSETELIQALWRAHRSLWSLSDTYQTVLGFENTVEIPILDRIHQKLRCQSELLKGAATFQDILESYTTQELALKNLSDDPIAMELEEEVEDDEEEEEALTTTTP